MRRLPKKIHHITILTWRPDEYEFYDLFGNIFLKKIVIKKQNLKITNCQLFFKNEILFLNLNMKNGFYQHILHTLHLYII